MLVAAAPLWIANNLTVIAAGTLLVFTILVVRLVQKAALRMALLAIFAGLAVFAYANRVELKQCARTCECSIAGKHLTVPACDADLVL